MFRLTLLCLLTLVGIAIASDTHAEPATAATAVSVRRLAVLSTK